MIRRSTSPTSDHDRGLVLLAEDAVHDAPNDAQAAKHADHDDDDDPDCKSRCSSREHATCIRPGGGARRGFRATDRRHARPRAGGTAPTVTVIIVSGGG